MVNTFGYAWSANTFGYAWSATFDDMSSEVPPSGRTLSDSAIVITDDDPYLTRHVFNSSKYG